MTRDLDVSSSISLVFKLCNSEENWKFLILELRVLSFRPILAHPNLVQLLGVDVPSPVLIMECGTLISLERRHLQEHTRLCLCRSSLALPARLFHHDVKSENVLVFKHPQRLVIAKLGNFDCCVDMNQSRLHPDNRKELILQNGYSFGTWRFLGAVDPFHPKFFSRNTVQSDSVAAQASGRCTSTGCAISSPELHAEGICSVFRHTHPGRLSTLVDDTYATLLLFYYSVLTWTNHGQQSEYIIPISHELISWLQRYSSSPLPEVGTQPTLLSS
jgi:hypothetical protein